MSKEKWLMIVGAALVLVGFFLPLVGFSIVNVSLSQVAGTLNQVLLYLVPIAMIVIIVLCLVKPTDPVQAKTYAYIQIGAWAASILGILITFYSLYSQIQQGMQMLGGLAGGLGGMLGNLGGTDITKSMGSIGISLQFGFYLLFLGHILAIVGAVMALNENKEPVFVDSGPSPVEGVTRIPDEYERRPVGKIANAWLVVRNGPKYDLYRGETTIGRSSRNQIRLSNDLIGREHAKIKEQNGHFTLYDLASKNGTLVNGYKIHQPTLLHSNDEINFGGVYKVTFMSPQK
jgi:hypothetical protein